MALDSTKTMNKCTHRKATTQNNLHPHKATTPDSMDCSKSLAIQLCYTSDPQWNSLACSHMGNFLLLFDPVRLALPGQLLLLLASHMKLCRSRPFFCLCSPTVLYYMIINGHYIINLSQNASKPAFPTPWLVPSRG